MDFPKLIGGIFAIIFSVILFLIIRYALKIMYKDVKNGTKKNKPQRQRPTERKNIDNQNRNGNTGVNKKAPNVDRLDRTGSINRTAGRPQGQQERQQVRPQPGRPQMDGGRTQANRMTPNRPQQPVRSNEQRSTQSRGIETRTQVRSQSRIPSVEVLSCKPGANVKIGTVIPVNRVITLGRKNDNLIVLNDNFASSYHAKLYLRNGEIILEDLNSTNGTFVNQRPVKGMVRLRVNDEVRLGETIFRVIG